MSSHWYASNVDFILLILDDVCLRFYFVIALRFYFVIAVRSYYFVIVIII